MTEQDTQTGNEHTPAIVANHNPLVDTKEFTFNFRKVKNEETGIESKRDSVTARLAVPSVEGIIKILEEGGKPLELLLSLVESGVTDYAKQRLADDPSLTSENFPVGEVTFEAIANLPETERKGRGIAKEVWEDFIKSYIETMPAVIGKPVEVVKKQASILAQKFQPLKNHEKKNELLPKFVEMLALYANGAPDAEQFTAPVEFLVRKAQEFMAADTSANLADNLGF
jgi:hypothetical protein